MPLFQYMKNMFSALIIVFYLFVVHHAEAADKMTQISVDRVKVGGEIGRRIDVTVNNNLLVVDINNDFLKPFQEKNLNRRLYWFGENNRCCCSICVLYRR